MPSLSKRVQPFFYTRAGRILVATFFIFVIPFASFFAGSVFQHLMSNDLQTNEYPTAWLALLTLATAVIGIGLFAIMLGVMENLESRVASFEYVEWEPNESRDFYGRLSQIVTEANESIYGLSPASIKKMATDLKGNRAKYRREYYRTLTNHIEYKQSQGFFTYNRILQIDKGDEDKSTKDTHGSLITAHIKSVLQASKGARSGLTHQIYKLNTKFNYGILVIDLKTLALIVDTVHSDGSMNHHGVFIIRNSAKIPEFARIVINLKNNNHKSLNWITLDDPDITDHPNLDDYLALVPIPSSSDPN